MQLVADYLNKNQPTSDGQKDCNVDAGKKYEIRVKKDGFAAAPAAVAPARAAETEADIEVRAK